MVDYYVVQVIPNDQHPNNYAMIHLETCSDFKKVGPVVGRRDLVGQWFGSYSTYQQARAEAYIDHKTSAQRTVVDCPTCHPQQLAQNLSGFSYWRGTNGNIYEVRTCWHCKGAKGGCTECGGYGVQGRDVTCFCSPARRFIPFDKDCSICRGTGIKNYKGPMPPVISPDPR